MRNTLAGAVTLLAVLSLTAGCGRPTETPAPGARKAGPVGTSTTPSTTPGITPSATPSRSPSAPAHDPPRRFAGKPIARIDGGPPAVADGIAYYYTDDGLAATDLATGEPRWQVPLQGATGLVTGPMQRDSPSVPGIVTDADGRILLVAAYFEIIEGSGTNADEQRTTVVALDTSGKVRWSQAVAPSLLPVVVGGIRDEQGAAVVLNAGDTVVLDAGSGAVRWTARGVMPAGVDGSTVVGLRKPDGDIGSWTPVGLRSGDGSQLWAGLSPRRELQGGTPSRSVPAGPGRIVVTTSTMTVVIDTASGRVVTRLPGAMNCVYDDRSTIVCSTPHAVGRDPEAVTAVDARSGRRLWSLPDEKAHRTAVDVTFAYHGAAYGSAENGPVVLDARSGADVTPDADIAPTRVVPGYGLVTDLTGDERKTEIYRSAG